MSARLEALREALITEPLNVVETNNALRQAVSRIVVDAKHGMLSLQWHHSDEAEHVSFYTRHKTWETGSFTYVRDKGWQESASPTATDDSEGRVDARES